LKGHQSDVYSANFSPDSQQIVTASKDNTARIWDLSGKQIAELKGHQSDVYSANFSPDSQQIVTASDDKNARIWRVDKNLDELLFRSCQWLNDYLVTHPEELLKLEICQDKPRLKAAATFMVEKGERLAREGNTTEAVADF
jgi:WD40 repeat protein